MKFYNKIPCYIMIHCAACQVVPSSLGCIQLGKNPYPCPVRRVAFFRRMSFYNHVTKGIYHLKAVSRVLVQVPTCCGWKSLKAWVPVFSNSMIVTSQGLLIPLEQLYWSGSQTSTFLFQYQDPEQSPASLQAFEFTGFTEALNKTTVWTGLSALKLLV